MPSPVCKTPHRSEIAPSSTSPIFVVGTQGKVQRAVLFPPFVEAMLRNVSMLTFSRRRIGPVREEVPVTRRKPLCLDVEDRNLQHAEDRACKTWRVQTEDPLARARHSCSNSKVRNVSRLTGSTDPGRPRVQPAELFPRVSWAGTGETISSLAPKPFSSEEASQSSVPELFARRNVLVQDRVAGSRWAQTGFSFLLASCPWPR